MNTHKKKGAEKRGKHGFRIGTFSGLFILAIVGIGLIIISYGVVKTEEIPHELCLFLGETFIGTAVLSVLIEIHSIQDNYQKVRDYLLLEEPSFIERYNEEEVDRIIELGIKQKIRLNSEKNIDKLSLDRLTERKNFLLEPYVVQMSEQLGSEGFYCKYHRRQININPISNEEYKIDITIELELQNITNEMIEYEQKYKFYYISKKQIESFKLNSLEINREDRREVLENIKKYSYDRPSTSRHPFDFLVEFSVPLQIEPKSQVHYVLNYEYYNYEQACYITYSLPFITNSFQETYSLIGENAYDYQLHASAYAPYKHKINNRNLVQRLNDVTLSINSNRWIVPGNGFVAIVRKKV